MDRGAVLLIQAFDRDGDFLDVGYANGLLASDVVVWAVKRGYRVVPHGIDLGEELIGLARGADEGSRTPSCPAGDA
jgi:2-polyprenyl-3-methyl-5-hydroxy-6-metoxy-1,4-benzoquinol methylase